MNTKQILMTIAVTVVAGLISLWAWDKIQNRKNKTEVAK